MDSSCASAVADAVNAAGLSGGADGEFMPSTAATPARCRHREELRHYNHCLLQSLGPALERQLAVGLAGSMHHRWRGDLLSVDS